MNHHQRRRALLASISLGLLTLEMTSSAHASDITSFIPGDLVISTVQDVAPNAANSGLDSASPIRLDQFSLGAGGKSATLTGTLTLPQTSVGANSAISGEYGSASEGILQRSANGQYLTMMGYGVNASTFNTAAATARSPYGTAALGQTTSVPGGASTVVPRVVALIGANGSVDTSTALTGVFNTNNPRSAATVDGKSFYVSGQGVTGDGSGGVFYATKGATTASPINVGSSPATANTTSPIVGTEARAVEIADTGGGNELYVSRDFSPSGKPNDSSDIRSLTDASGNLPTSSAGLAATRLLNVTASGTGSSLGGNTSSINLTSPLDNNVNGSRNGKFVYLSPEQFFFANAGTLYIADSGSPKNGSAGAAALGEGGLQKWSLLNNVWTLDYDMYAGLNLADSATANSTTPSANGVTGLFGLTGQVEINGTVELFATSYGLNELSQSYLYEVTDTLANLSPVGTSESFNTLFAAPAGTDIRGVAFAPVSPVPLPPALPMFGAALIGLAAIGRGLNRRTAASPQSAPV